MHFLRNKRFLSAWTLIAAFGTYFCTYAFRKPFSAGTFEGLYLFGMEYKIVLILTQIFGYMVSKFIGISVISTLKPQSRIRLILFLIGIAEVGLLFFSLLPPKFAWIFMFLNGLPLGMVWGIVFSFLEGRKLTEFLAIGLSANMVMTSGILKSLYFYVQQLTGFSEFLMPFFMGIIFMIPLGIFLWMLLQIPPPTSEDVLLRNKRIPMNAEMKKEAIRTYGFGIGSIIILYTLLTTTRDFRDNFLVEIWSEISPHADTAIYAKTETLIAIIVLLGVAAFTFIKNNHTAFLLITVCFLSCLLYLANATHLLSDLSASSEHWMIWMGVALFFPYLLIQIAYFERLIALLNIKGNVGFFVYLCDSFGYLGSVLFLLYKQFWASETLWTALFIQLTDVVAYAGIGLTLFQLLFFGRKYLRLTKKAVSPSYEKIS